jgi:hypothetical protein
LALNAIVALVSITSDLVETVALDLNTFTVNVPGTWIAWFAVILWITVCVNLSGNKNLSATTFWHNLSAPIGFSIKFKSLSTWDACEAFVSCCESGVVTTFLLDTSVFVHWVSDHLAWLSLLLARKALSHVK